MALDWNRMEKTPAGALARKQSLERSAVNLESLARDYDIQVRELLTGKDGEAISDEISGFAQAITSAREGSEQDDQIERLLNRLKLRRPSLFEDILPEDTRERTAFALALVGNFQRSRQ